MKIKSAFKTFEKAFQIIF